MHKVSWGGEQTVPPGKDEPMASSCFAKGSTAGVLSGCLLSLPRRRVTATLSFFSFEHGRSSTAAAWESIP
ncbi:hypothetical protein L1987_23803 [Smallanthus sonchifolius]|uniref:Uncharacterized protein n=1 Tax=Smallanthus sonchifolius TaxID=185202 RepID=A0ACB9ILB3_9ASTR|nr:hypothetical protein L1987_23803 [Smallanthus sonchifolius]